MQYQWVLATMLYYLISYYVIYLPGNTYVEMYSSGAAEICGTIFGGFILRLTNAKVSFIVSNVIALIGGLLILFYEHGSLLPLFIMIAKFGISSAFCLVYAVTIDLFPTLFAG